MRRVRWAWGGVTDERRASLSTISGIARTLKTLHAIHKGPRSSWLHQEVRRDTKGLCVMSALSKKGHIVITYRHMCARYKLQLLYVYESPISDQRSRARINAPRRAWLSQFACTAVRYRTGGSVIAPLCGNARGGLVIAQVCVIAHRGWLTDYALAATRQPGRRARGGARVRGGRVGAMRVGPRPASPAGRRGRRVGGRRGRAARGLRRRASREGAGAGRTRSVGGRRPASQARSWRWRRNQAIRSQRCWSDEFAALAGCFRGGR